VESRCFDGRDDSASGGKMQELSLWLKMNPLVLNYISKRAIDYCTEEEKGLYHISAHYQQ
jgi:hypothetical protein